MTYTYEYRAFIIEGHKKGHEWGLIFRKGHLGGVEANWGRQWGLGSGWTLATEDNVSSLLAKRMPSAAILHTNDLTEAIIYVIETLPQFRVHPEEMQYWLGHL